MSFIRIMTVEALDDGRIEIMQCMGHYDDK